MVNRPQPGGPERIIALYSQGPHFVRMLKRLRAEYPSEHIIAAIPDDYGYDGIQDLADEVLRLPEAGGTVRRGLKVARALRRARCAHVVVMFNSPRLNLLARLSGARVLWCFSADGRMTRLESGVGTAMLAALAARIRGEWAWRRAKWGTRRKSRSGD